MPSIPGLASVRVALDGWTRGEAIDDFTVWLDPAGQRVGLQILEELDLPESLDPLGVQGYFRQIAEDREGGLIEAIVDRWRHGPAIHGIYKKSKGHGFAFTGLLCMPMPAASLVWSTSCYEGGMTGVREAAVTAMLLQRGELSLDTFNDTWAQDPYDPGYRALGRVDSKVLHYGSDAECYDGVVPGHPLTWLRATFRALRSGVAVDPDAFGCHRAS